MKFLKKLSRKKNNNDAMGCNQSRSPHAFHDTVVATPPPPGHCTRPASNTSATSQVVSYLEEQRPTASSTTTASTNANHQRHPSSNSQQDHRLEQIRQVQQQQHKVILPDQDDFHPSRNGRNGFLFSMIYEKSEEALDGGNFGQIFQCTHRMAGQGADGQEPYWKIGAVKITHPNALDTHLGPINSYQDIEERCQEIRTLNLLQQEPRSPHILRLQEYFYNRNNRELRVVTELLQNNLRDWLEEQPQFTERQGRAVAKVLLKAIQFMHKRNIIHRDIKEANVVFARNGDMNSLKVVDFGLAKQLRAGENERAFCGSLGYIAPEIYQREPYRFKVDLFSFGVLMFKILSGKRPWPAGPPELTGRRTVSLEYKIEKHQWRNVSSNGADFIRHLLVFEEERLDAEQALNHEWLEERTQSILRVGRSSRFEIEDGPSDDAGMNPDGATRVQESRDKTRFWIEDNVHDALATFIPVGGFRGRSIGNQNGHVCMEEAPPEGALLLPYHISRFSEYTERECRNLCREVARRIQLFHSANVVHRKLHMENILVESQLGYADFNVSLRGVQYAQMIRENEPLTGRVGRKSQFRGWHAFIAPEIESEFYHDQRVDLWSLGAIIYMCLTGSAPNKPEMYFQVVSPSGPAENLVRNLLQPNPSHRLTIEEVLRHPWMVADDNDLARHGLDLTLVFFKEDYRRAGRRNSSTTSRGSNNNSVSDLMQQ